MSLVLIFSFGLKASSVAVFYGRRHCRSQFISKLMFETTPRSNAYREFDLVKARQIVSKLQPASHQNAALEALHRWFESSRKAPHGGIVALPTGGGKTFTAVRFLCCGPLSRGYKVLWLAHTHHLLDQAYAAFAPREEERLRERGLEVGLIAEPRTALKVRVVSGTPGHFPAHTISATDDVVIATLQTMARAVQNLHSLPGLSAWLKGACDLAVVFDEAHHSPAPSYRELINSLRESHPNLLLLGLTATPTYSDESKRGWLKKLFPQGILHQVSPKKLMLDGVLAKPIFEGCETNVTPEWNEREYQKWLGTYTDLPEEIVTHLAENRGRNALIAQTYADNRTKYGRTIIFAERWYQCEQIREFLGSRGVKSGAVYTHVEGSAGTARERNKRGKSANERELEAFRSGELDVLVNVRMLTEGTDVPDVQTVFLTRQTTSRILLTQMVGRALRGPKFGGTPTAYIVAFHDAWQQTPPFASFELEDGSATEERKAATPRAPLHLVSIELVRQLARATDRGVTIAPAAFTSLMPLGWYVTTFDSRPDGRNDDVETVRDLILVFDRDKESYEKFIAHLLKQGLQTFSSEGVTLEQVRPTLEEWHSTFFGSGGSQDISERLRNLLDIARHMAQCAGSDAEIAPPFVAFDARQDNDLDAIAQGHIRADLGPAKVLGALQQEFERGDRLWKVIYPNFATFKSQYDACVNRLLMVGGPSDIPAGVISQPEARPEREPSDELKRQVKERDGGRCLCCGEDRPRRLQVDHVAAWYSSGNNALDNLQTLCKSCNSLKGINEINFRLHCNRARRGVPGAFPRFPLPEKEAVCDAAQWERYLRRHINFFFGCGAVHYIFIGARGRRFYEWEIELCEGNDPQWLKAHLKELRNRVRLRIQEGRRDGCVMQRLIVTAPGAKTVSYPERSRF